MKTLEINDKIFILTFTDKNNQPYGRKRDKTKNPMQGD